MFNVNDIVYYGSARSVRYRVLKCNKARVFVVLELKSNRLIAGEWNNSCWNLYKKYDHKEAINLKVKQLEEKFKAKKQSNKPVKSEWSESSTQDSTTYASVHATVFADYTERVEEFVVPVTCTHYILSEDF